MGYIKVAPLCMYDSTRWVLGIIRGCHTSNNLHRAEKLKLSMVAPSRVCSSPHTLFVAPLPTQTVGSGAAEKVCGLERTREGATMGNFNFSALWIFLDVWHPLIIPNTHLVPSYMHKGATFM